MPIELNTPESRRQRFELWTRGGVEEERKGRTVVVEKESFKSLLDEDEVEVGQSARDRLPGGTPKSASHPGGREGRKRTRNAGRNSERVCKVRCLEPCDMLHTGFE